MMPTGPHDCTTGTVPPTWSAPCSSTLTQAAPRHNGQSESLVVLMLEGRPVEDPCRHAAAPAADRVLLPDVGVAVRRRGRRTGRAGASVASSGLLRLLPGLTVHVCYRWVAPLPEPRPGGSNPNASSVTRRPSSGLTSRLSTLSSTTTSSWRCRRYRHGRGEAPRTASSCTTSSCGAAPNGRPARSGPTGNPAPLLYLLTPQALVLAGTLTLLVQRAVWSRLNSGSRLAGIGSTKAR